MLQQAKKQTNTTKKQNHLLITAITISLILILMLAVTILSSAKDKPSEDSFSVSLVSCITTDYIAEIEIENYGTITVALDATSAPATVENFVSLAESAFYNGLTFHRIIDGFMIQGGDPKGNGTGGAEQKITGEFKANGHNNSLSHIRGAISMARSSDFNSASSQFFIVHEDSVFLDGQYAVFGYVTDGIEIVDAICKDAVPTDNNGSISRENQPVIKSVTIQPGEG